MDYRSEKFEGYAFGESPTYLSDMEGAFETARCEGRGGKCLRQVIAETPLTWMRTSYPISLYGDITWRDYTVSTDVLLEEKASVAVAARITNEYNSTWRPSLNIWNGYWFWIDDSGRWRLELRPTQLRPPAQNPPVVLDSGTLSAGLGTDRWHRVAVDVQAERVSVAVDGRTVTSVTDASIPNGQVGMAVDSYSNVQFDNLSVQPH
jgi:hypothetical protein